MFRGGSQKSETTCLNQLSILLHNSDLGFSCESTSPPSTIKPRLDRGALLPEVVLLGKSPFPDTCSAHRPVHGPKKRHPACGYTHPIKRQAFTAPHPSGETEPEPSGFGSDSRRWALHAALQPQITCAGGSTPHGTPFESCHTSVHLPAIVLRPCGAQEPKRHGLKKQPLQFPALKAPDGPLPENAAPF